MVETRFRRYENMVSDMTVEYREKVIECMIRNGIEGGFLDNIKSGVYDRKIERLIRCDFKTTPLEFVKDLINEELW